MKVDQILICLLDYLLVMCIAYAFSSVIDLI